MAQYKINVPNKNITPLTKSANSPIANNINKITKNYGKIINEVAANSNVPAELLIAVIGELSNGDETKSWKTGDGFMRSGLFALSETVGKQVLAREKAQGRMNEAEAAFLRGAGDENLIKYLSDTKLLSAPNPNTWWSTAATTGLNRISETNKQLPINWKNPKIAIQTGAIWIGQIWDEIGKQVNDPLDKVLITLFYPYGANYQRGNQKAYFGQPWLSGASYIKAYPWNVDFTDPKQEVGRNFLTGSSTPYDADKWGDVHPQGSFFMIKRDGGHIYTVLQNILGENGYLDQLIV